MPQPVDPKEMKQILKEAIKEWLDQQFAAFGRWSFMALCSAGMAALAYFILAMNGWHR